MSKSYLILNEDNTFVLYLYYTSLNRGVITDGTYSVLEDGIILNSYKYGKEVYTFDGINLVGDKSFSKINTKVPFPHSEYILH